MTEDPRPRRKRRRPPESAGDSVSRKPRRRPASRKVARAEEDAPPVRKNKATKSGRKKKKKRKDHDEGWSTKQVITLVMIGIAMFGWACAAAAYAHAKEGWRSNEVERFAEEHGDELESSSRLSRRGARSAMIKTAARALMDFIGNAFKQLPNCLAVTAFTFSERLWLIILFAVLEAGALGLGFVMEKVGEGFVETPRY